MLRLPTAAASEVVDGNINQYCTLNAGGRRPIKELSMGEKEQLFLEALSVRRPRARLQASLPPPRSSTHHWEQV